MSGPKIDYAELERQKRIELERQRLERIRKINEATNSLVRTQERVKKTIQHIRNDLNFELTFCSHILREEIKKAKDDALATLNQILNVKSIPTEPDEIEALNQLMIHAFNQTYADQYLRKMKQIKTVIENEHETEIHDEKLCASFTFNQFIKRKEDNNNGNKDNPCFAVNCDKDVSVTDDSLLTKINSIFECVQDLVNSDAIDYENKRNMFDIRSDLIASLDSDFNVQDAIINESELLIHRVKYNIQLFNDIYMRYYSEYISYVDEVNKTRRNKLDILPKEKHQFKNIEELENELLMLRIRTRRLSEQNYIRSQLDEVMKELGYHMSEEFVFNSSTGQHLLCKSGTDSTALHVHISDKNVMIEVVGCHNGVKDEYDEIVTADELTDEETETLLESQNKFCDLHPVICRKLKERGVIFNPVSHKMPSLKYCKKVIINNGEEALTDELLINNTRRESNMHILSQLAVKPKGE